MNSRAKRRNYEPLSRRRLPLLAATCTLLILVACAGGSPAESPVPQTAPQGAPHTREPKPLVPSADLPPHLQAIQSTAVITVDFSVPIANPKSMIGFNFFLRGTKFGRNDVEPIQPGLFRSNGGLFRDPNLYSTKEALGTRYVFEVATWGLPNRYTGRDPKRPYLDFEKYRSYLREVAAATRGRDIIYDIWNEPNNRPGPNNVFWFGGSEAQFFETFKIAHDTLREELGQEIKICGPSDSRFDAARLDRFMKFARANKLTVDVLAWHELDVRSLPQMARDLREVRRRYVESPDFSSVGVKEILIPEIIGRTQSLRPAANLAYLYYLEQGGADGAARSCWTHESGGVSTCVNNSLNGLLTNGRGRRRPVWWTAKAYADTLASRVHSTSNNESVTVFASSTGAEQGAAQVVVGLYEHELWTLTEQAKREGRIEKMKAQRAQLEQLLTSKTLELRLAGLSSVASLAGKTSLSARIQRIPFKDEDGARPPGEAALGAPLEHGTRQVTVVDGETQIVIQNAQLHDVYIVQLRPN